MLHAGRTAPNPIGGCTYSTRGDGTHCALTGHRRAVHTRVRKIQGERVNDARRIDARFCGTQPGDDGPVLGRLRSTDSELKGRWTDPPAEKLPFSACWNQGALVLRGVCLWLVIVLRSTRPPKKSRKEFWRVWAGFLPLAPYSILGTVLKSARQQPEFGLSGFAFNAKSKSAEFLLSRAFRPPSGG